MILKACAVTCGSLNQDVEYNGYLGPDNQNIILKIIFLYNEDDEIFAFVLKEDDAGIFAGSTDPGTPDSNSLRRILPEGIEANWNNILLASIDIDEIADEGLEHYLYSPDYDVDDTTRHYYLGFDFSDPSELEQYIFVELIYGHFEFAAQALAEGSLEDFMNGDIEEPIQIFEGSLGEIIDFQTETEQLCLIPAR